MLSHIGRRARPRLRKQNHELQLKLADSRKQNRILEQKINANREKLTIFAQETSNKETLTIENQKLQEQMQEMERICRTFLHDDQIKMLQDGRMSFWPNDVIVKGLKFRFALSNHGYEYLRSTGYPLPAYSTIMRRIQNYSIDFGVFDDVINLLKFKVPR